MSSHNTRPDGAFYKTPVLDKEDIEEAKVVSTRLISDADFSIEDDPDAGCDPYNTTGQHVVLRQKRLPKE